MDSESKGVLASLQEALKMAEEEVEKALIQEIGMMTARDIARHQWDVQWAAVSEKTAAKEERQKAQTQLHCARGRWNVAR